MTALNKITILSLALGLFSCNVKKTEYTPPDIKVDLKYEEILKSLRTGGQPGEISLSGVTVESDGTISKRISIEQSVGKSEEETKLSEKSKPKLNSLLKRKDDYKPTTLGKYLNVGCDLKGDFRIEGLEEQKNKPNEFGITDVFGAAASMVDKIFICGKVEVFEAVVLLNANEIYLNDADLRKEKQIGLVNITTDNLILEGKNTIFTSGVSDSTASFLSAPDIKINVYNILGGTGELKLASQGGDYIKSEKK